MSKISSKIQNRNGKLIDTLSHRFHSPPKIKLSRLQWQYYINFADKINEILQARTSKMHACFGNSYQFNILLPSISVGEGA